MSEDKEESRREFPGAVTEVLNAYTLVINRGEQDGVEKGQEYIVYALSEEPLTDPDTGEQLERLEQVKGKGKVVHVQQKIATIQSNRKESDRNERVVHRGDPLGGTVFGEEKVEIKPDPDVLPFNDPERGDRVRPS